MKMFELAKLNRLEVNIEYLFRSIIFFFLVFGSQLQLFQQCSPQFGLSIPFPEAFGFTVNPI